MRDDFEEFANQIHETFKNVPGAKVEIIKPPCEWNGKELPPVGKCQAKQKGEISWSDFDVVAEKFGTVFGFWLRTGACGALDSDRWEFRPVPNEEVIKREEAIKALNDVCWSCGDDVYDAIVAGKIPHITLK